MTQVPPLCREGYIHIYRTPLINISPNTTHTTTNSGIFIDLGWMDVPEEPNDSNTNDAIGHSILLEFEQSLLRWGCHERQTDQVPFDWDVTTDYWLAGDWPDLTKST